MPVSSDNDEQINCIEDLNYSPIRVDTKPKLKRLHFRNEQNSKL